MSARPSRGCLPGLIALRLTAIGFSCRLSSNSSPMFLQAKSTLAIPLALFFLQPLVDLWGGTLRLEFNVRDPKTPTVTRMDWLVSGLALQRKDGTWVEGVDWFGYLSAKSGPLQIDADGVSSEEFCAIRFRIGLDSATDKADPAQWPPGHALNPAVNHLHWGWLGGYIFLALEGHEPGQTGGADGFSYHLAGASEPMVVVLPVEFRGGGPVTIRIGIEVAKLLDGVDPVRDRNSTHSRPGDPLAIRMKNRVAAAFDVESVGYDLLQPRTSSESVKAEYPAGTTAYALGVTARFPQVVLPPDNPLTVEGIALGYRLFHEPRLSITNTQSCASCHDQATAFADSRRFSVGAEGHTGKRNAMPLFNLAWSGSFFWDGRANSLREQVLQPIEERHEMNERLDRVVAKLTADPLYVEGFERAFGQREITAERLALALEQFLFTLISQDSRFDLTVRKLATMSEEEKRGLQLFVTEHDPARQLRGADCFHCHGGTLFSDFQFHDNGLELDADDLGRMLVTGLPSDRGKFKTPSLRNIALTAPYMHDGRFATLEEVIEHYDSAVRRNPNLDPNLAKHPASGLRLTAEEKAALIAFLRTLTDENLTKPLAESVPFASLPPTTQKP
jgi:cytochrome c peroxidase